jgi:sugar phosphate isomerase/epimerase
MRSLSLSPLTVLPCSPREQLEAAAEAGFDTVGLRLIPTLPTDVDVMCDQAMQKTIAALVSDSGLRVFDIEVARVTPDLDVTSLRRTLDYAGRLGAQRLAVTSAGHDTVGAEEAAVVDRLGALCEETERYDMGVMLEFMAFRAVATLADAVRVVAAVGKPNLAITMDTLHFFRSGGVVGDLIGIAPSLLACVQLSDAPRMAPEDLQAEARGGRLYPGQGDLPLAELVAALPRDLPMSVEAPSRTHAGRSVVERARESARWTRELLAEAM